MQAKQHILNITIILLILLIVLIGVMNVLISSYVNDLGIFKNQHENVVAIPQEPVKTFLQGPEDNTLLSEDPAQYNIQVLTDRDLRLSQAQGDVDIWDVNMKKILLHSNAAGHREGAGKTPKELKERLNRINGKIKDLEKIDQKSPGDRTEKLELQSLYVLRSSLTALEEAVGEKTAQKK